MHDRFQAILLDLDGTLVSDGGKIHHRTLSALRAVSSRGVHVMIVTGRSEASALPVIEELGIPFPAVIYNGAAIYCPLEKTLIEERTLNREHLDCLLAYAEREDLLTVVMCSTTKRALSPKSEVHRHALHDMPNIELVSPELLRVDRPIRLSLFSDHHEDAESFVRDVRRESSEEAYFTWFPLNLLPGHQDSPLLVVDVQPACSGKAEALRYLLEVHGVVPEEVVAVGDATNDIPMLEPAGLGVAMGNSMPELKEIANRVIGTSDSDTIACLVEELWGEPG